MITYFIVLSMIFITHAQTSPSPCPPPPQKKNFVLLFDILFTLCHAKISSLGVCLEKTDKQFLLLIRMIMRSKYQLGDY